MGIKVVDFFCGCGGTSKGLQQAGLEIALGIDSDRDAASSYKANFKKAKFLESDIVDVTFDQIKAAIDISQEDTLVFCGCAPCQPFSRIKTNRPESDTRKGLLAFFGKFVDHFKPDYVVVENVPGLQTIDPKEGPFKEFLEVLTLAGYPECQRKHDVLECQYYGVPQCRRRLVLTATRHRMSAPWPVRTHGPGGVVRNEVPTVWETIQHLPPIAAGGEHPEILDHKSMKLSADNLKRIKATPAEKGRECWPSELGLKCHENHVGHTDVYGRLRKNAPAAALTTKCISLSNGRFGHPVQDRAISIREAALLQTFPLEFVFEGSMGSKARQIGNAVPVNLATQIGLAIVEHDRMRRREHRLGAV
jgi:DNA (cytosine-5)-methyltransferase 1